MRKWTKRLLSQVLTKAMNHVCLSKAFGKSIDRREKVVKVGEKQ